MDRRANRESREQKEKRGWTVETEPREQRESRATLETLASRRQARRALLGFLDLLETWVAGVTRDARETVDQRVFVDYRVAWVTTGTSASTSWVQTVNLEPTAPRECVATLELQDCLDGQDRQAALDPRDRKEIPDSSVETATRDPREKRESTSRDRKEVQESVASRESKEQGATSVTQVTKVSVVPTRLVDRRVIVDQRAVKDQEAGRVIEEELGCLDCARHPVNVERRGNQGTRDQLVNRERREKLELTESRERRVKPAMMGCQECLETRVLVDARELAASLDLQERKERAVGEANWVPREILETTESPVNQDPKAWLVCLDREDPKD